MNKIAAVGLAAVLTAGSVAATTATAEARISPAGAAIAGGIFGFALGALATQPHYSTYGYYPYATYGYAYPDADDYAPTVTYGYSGNSHVAWCEANYRSYNPATDTYLGYDGYLHRCVSPY
jgi:hypothetical protein